MFATRISNILEKFSYESETEFNLETVILADVTYGACCVDGMGITFSDGVDYTAVALGCDLLIHYGHSCLIPVSETKIKHALYVFVSISFDMNHLIESLFLTATQDPTIKDIALVGTVQFTHSLEWIKSELIRRGWVNEISIPQIKPLSSGELLGCTSPKFGLSSIMYSLYFSYHNKIVMSETGGSIWNLSCWPTLPSKLFATIRTPKN